MKSNPLVGFLDCALLQPLKMGRKKDKTTRTIHTDRHGQSHGMRKKKVYETAQETYGNNRQPGGRWNRPTAPTLIALYVCVLLHCTNFFSDFVFLSCLVSPFTLFACKLFLSLHFSLSLSIYINVYIYCSYYKQQSQCGKCCLTAAEKEPLSCISPSHCVCWK